LFGLFQAEWTYKPVSIVRDIDVGHIAWVIDARFALQMVPALIDQMGTGLAMVIDRLMLM